MANYPFMKIYTCSESVVNADYIDITYNLANCKNIISVTAISDNNIAGYVLFGGSKTTYDQMIDTQYK